MKDEREVCEVHNHYEAGSNCQVFNGPVSGAIFAMPGSTVNQYGAAEAPESCPADRLADMPLPTGSATEAADLQGQQQPQEALNLFAPQKHLQQMLRQAWFAETRTDERYDAQWADSFVEALMASEYGEAIAREWAVKGVRNKRNQLKGYVVGLLRDGGVMSGSYSAIAVKAGIVEDARTFARYMADGKKQPYAEWVRQWLTEDAMVGAKD